VKTLSEKKLISVLIVDDHPMMRAGLAGEVNAQSDMTVVAEAADGEEAILLYKRHRPDITLMDIRMPNTNGIDAITAIRSEYAYARVIILTTYGGDAQATRAFKAGAVGYIEKNTLRSELVDTIRLVYAGHRKIPPGIAIDIAEHMTDELLTARELEIIRGVAKGKANKILAADLNISEHTVKNHLQNILAKLSASDRTHAVTIALKRGIIDL
jgi:DNA-binding NarL/FixJ family response regulator